MVMYDVERRGTAPYPGLMRTEGLPPLWEMPAWLIPYWIADMLTTVGFVLIGVGSAGFVLIWLRKRVGYWRR